MLFWVGKTTENAADVAVKYLVFDNLVLGKEWLNDIPLS